MNKGLGVWYLNCTTKEVKAIYECIPTFKEADVLAQIAMRNCPADCIVIITPGWYRDLTEDELAVSSELVEKYKVLEPRIFS